MEQTAMPPESTDNAAQRGQALDAGQVGVAGAVRLASFRRLLGASAISAFGGWASLGLVPATVAGLGGSAVGLALVVGSYFISISFVSVWGGALGDKYSRRSLMIAADLFSFLVQGAFAIWLLTGNAELWMLMLTQVLLGVATGLFQPQLNGVVAECVPQGARRGANALRGIVDSSGKAIGPLVGIALMTSMGVGWAFAVDALTFLASAVVLKSLSRVDDPPMGEARAYGTLPEVDSSLEIAAGWRAFRQTPWFAVVVLVSAVLNAFAFGPFQILGATVSQDSLGGSGAWPVVLASLGLGAVVGGLAALTWNPSRPLLAANAVTLFWALPMVFLAVAAPLPAIAIAAVLAGASGTFFGAIWETTVQDYVPLQLISRLSSYDIVGSFFLLPIGYVLAAVAIGTIGAVNSLLFTAALVIGGVAVVLSCQSVRQLGGAPATEPLTRMDPAVAATSQ